MIAELAADAGCQVAEGPVWHPVEQRLYWTDIPAGKVYRFDPDTNGYELVFSGAPVGGIAVQQDGSLLLLGAQGRASVWRNGEIADVILPGIPDEHDTRFNDLVVDPDGRVISGTMAVRDDADRIVRHGNLYRLGTDGTCRKITSGLGSPNGMGFTPDLRQLYFTDSFYGTQALYRFDYDRASGALTNKRLFHQTPLDGSDGRPDGMTVDKEGYLWSARWDGGAVVRFRPDGTELERFPIPVAKVSSVTFGGPDYTDLYITTARGDVDEPGAGGVFRLQSAGHGRPEFRSRIGC